MWLRILLALPLLAAAACTQSAAPVVQKGNNFYGRNGHFSNDMEMARYSNDNRAVQDEQIAAKYQSEEHHYSVPAQVDSIQSSTLPPPEPIQVSSVDPVEPITAVSTQPVSAPFSFKQSTYVTPERQPESIPQLASLPEVTPENRMVQAVQADQVAQTSLAEQPMEQHFIWPAEGKIVSHFGPKGNGLVNDGINIGAPEGEPIWAAAKGEVVYSGNELKGYGNMLILKHSDGWMTAYAHASDILVNKGDKVEQGDLVGYVGRTGSVKTAQLHFGIREGDKPVNPEELLPKRVAAVQ